MIEGHMERKKHPPEKTPDLSAIFLHLEPLGSDTKIMKIHYFHFFENLAGFVFSSKSIKKVPLLKKKLKFWGKSMFWQALGSDKTFFQKNGKHHLGRTANTKNQNNPEISGF